MHTPLLTGAAVVHTRAPENKTKCQLITMITMIQSSEDRFRFLLPLQPSMARLELTHKCSTCNSFVKTQDFPAKNKNCMEEPRRTPIGVLRVSSNFYFYFVSFPHPLTLCKHSGVFLIWDFKAPAVIGKNRQKCWISKTRPSRICERLNKAHINTKLRPSQT